MENEKEKIGIVFRVAPLQGGIVFKDEPDTWYNAIPTAKNEVKAGLKGKQVKIRLADKPHKFSFISLHGEQLEAAPEAKEDPQGEEKVAPMSKDEYWKNKEARDIIKEEKISRHGALNTALEAVKISSTSGSSVTAVTPEQVIKLAETIAKNNVLPFVKGEDK